MAEKNINKKIALKLDNIDYASFDYKGNKVIVKTLLDQDDKIFLYNNYVGMFFEGEGVASERFLSAKYSFMLGIVGLCTNIEISNLNLDELVASGVWTEIVKRIKNYDQAKKDVYALTKMMSEERLAAKSIGQVLDNFYSVFSNFIVNLDADKLNEQAQKLISEFKSGIEKLENNGIVVPENLSQKEK